MRMSSIPASAMISASPSFWQVMPFAPAATCSFASKGLLWVLICGRLATPAASQAAWIRAMLRSTLSMSITAQGVPYSFAILAARGVVIWATPIQYLVIASEAKQSMLPMYSGLLRRGVYHRAGQKRPDPLAPRNDETHPATPARFPHVTLPARASGFQPRQDLPAFSQWRAKRHRTSCDPSHRAPDRRATFVASPSRPAISKSSSAEFPARA